MDAVDNGSGIDLASIEAVLDGVSYDYSSGRITFSGGKIQFTLPSDLADGSHEFIITIRDKTGNVRVLSSSGFNLSSSVSFVEVYGYPEPFSPEAGVTLRYVLSTPAVDVKIKITDISGRVMRELSGTGNVDSNSVVWDGKDLNGNTVLSQVYFCHISGSDELGKAIEKRFRICGWNTK